MEIDFTMGGLNICLLIGIVVLLEGICLFVFQNPVKKFKRFSVRDFIIFGIILSLVLVGITLTTVGIVSAINIS